jgi:hypothetical protein
MRISMKLVMLTRMCKKEATIFRFAHGLRNVMAIVLAVIKDFVRERVGVRMTDKGVSLLVSEIKRRRGLTIQISKNTYKM